MSLDKYDDARPPHRPHDPWTDDAGEPRQGGDGVARAVEGLRRLQDTLTAARPPEDVWTAVATDLDRLADMLSEYEVPEREQVVGHRRDLPGRGQAMSPTVVVDDYDDQQVRGHVTFGRHYLGGNGAVHGGAIPLLFDEVLGRLANAGGRDLSRTAYLHVDFRSVTPVGSELQIRGWFDREEGRKRLLRATLTTGDRLCAEAEGLFVALRPGQP